MQFLSDLTGRAGKNLITGPHKTKLNKKGGTAWEHRWVDFTNEAETQRAIDYIETNCTGTYFALGCFASSQGSHLRRQANQCASLKAFWFDIDCGEDKWAKHNGKGCYRTREDGQVAFTSFMQSTGLPFPTYIVSSGAGYHVYWQLDRELTLAEWRPLALTLKRVCARWQFEADPMRTADAATVLRVPGTSHKSGSIVEIITQSAPTTVEAFTAALDRLRPYINEPQFQETFDRTMGLGEKPAYLEGVASTMDEHELSIPRKFANIILKSEYEGTGCNQLLHAYKQQEHIPEPLWAGALSIANFCLDGEEWALKISENHPEFDPEVTLRKMRQWTAPRTCKWFADNYPEYCKGCPHLHGTQKNGSQSPIMLATDDNRVPTVVQDVMSGGSTTETEEFVIPAYPFPYFRNQEVGGIWRQDQEGISCVYDFDLYIYDRIGMGADNRPRFWARQHTPHDGVSEIELSSDDLFGPPATLVQRLAAHNILIPPEMPTQDLYKLLRGMAAGLQRTRAMTKPPKQMGWTDRASFVLGRWEYSRAGRKMSPVQDSNIARMFREACEIRSDYRDHVADWNRSLETLYGADDAALYRLILACGYGAPIRCKYGMESGGVINIYSEDSGFGKSTLTKVISGIYGQTPDPFFYQARQGTTINAFFEIISYVNSLPMTLDETGQLDVEDLMLFVHTCTSGRAKARSSHQVNDVRQSLPGWRTHVFSSSNVSLWNRITEHRAENEAYLMRIVEIPIRALKQSTDKNYGDAAVREIQKYYGVAGPVLIDYIIQNGEYIAQLWHDVSTALTSTCKLHGRHRFWGDIMTSAVVGAKIGEEAGVFPFSAKEIYRSACHTLHNLVERAETKVLKESDLLGEMFNTYADSTIVVKNSRTSTAAIKTPQRRAFIRIELDDRKLYIDQVALREYAKTRQFGIERLEIALEEIGGQRGVLKRMWDNTDIQAANPTVRTWYVDLTNELAQQYINQETLYADTGTSNQ